MEELHLIKSEYGDFLIKVKSKLDRVNNLNYYFAKEFHEDFGIKASGFDIDTVKKDMKKLFEKQMDMWLDSQINDLNIKFESKTWKKK